VVARPAVSSLVSLCLQELAVIFVVPDLAELSVERGGREIHLRGIRGSTV